MLGVLELHFPDPQRRAGAENVRGAGPHRRLKYCKVTLPRCFALRPPSTHIESTKAKVYNSSTIFLEYLEESWGRIVMK